MVRMPMSNKDLERLHIMEKVCRKEMKLNQAAKLLGLSKSQSIRLKKRYKQEGAAGLISRKLGAPSNNQIPEEHKLLVINFLSQEDHRDFSPLLVHEYLSKEHAEFISISSVRNIMIRNGLWVNRKNKSKKVYRLRQRKDQFGEMVQKDGSEHDWFEGRGPRCTLLVYIDDATNYTWCKFVKSENTWDYLRTTREYIEKHGRPHVFYTDKHSVFRINREGALTGDGRTQYGRVMEELGIRLTCANSPQAKGRVERRNRDLQNRLVKAMRLAKISNTEQANAFLPLFLEEFNRRFTKPAKSPFNAHRPLINDQDLDKVFCLKYTRRISKNLILQYKGVLYQIYAEGLEYTLRQKDITVIEYEEGQVHFENNGKRLKAIAYKEVEAPTEVVSSKELLTVLAKQRSKAKQRYKPGANHPWKQGARRRSNMAHT